MFVDFGKRQQRKRKRSRGVAASRRGRQAVFQVSGVPLLDSTSSLVRAELCELWRFAWQDLNSFEQNLLQWILKKKKKKKSQRSSPLLYFSSFKKVQYSMTKAQKVTGRKKVLNFAPSESSCL